MSTLFFNQPDSPADLFFRALNEGNAARCEELISQGVHVDTLGYDQRTGLHLASLNGNFDVAAALIKAGAKIDAQDKGGNTPLHLAAYKDRGEMCALLAAHGANLNITDKSMEGGTPLHVAISQGANQAIDELVNAGADVNSLDAQGIRPLDRLYHPLRLDTLQRIIDAGAILRPGYDLHERYVLKNMITFYHAPQALLLIANGAVVPQESKKIDKVDPASLTRKTAAVRGGHLQALVRLLDAEPEPACRKDAPNNLLALARRHASRECEMVLHAFSAKQEILKIQKKAMTNATKNQRPGA